MVETDARLTADGTVAFLHDSTLDRTTSCTGAVATTGDSRIAECDAGYWFMGPDHQDFPYRGQGLTVPSFDDLAAILQPIHWRVAANIEIKDLAEYGIDETDRLVTSLVSLMQELELTDRITVSSFSSGAIDVVKAIDASVMTALLCRPAAEVPVQLATVLDGGHFALHLHHSSLAGKPAPELVRWIHDAGVDVNVWTVNDPDRWRSLIAAGVDGIITDDPAGLRRVLSNVEGSDAVGSDR